jgi:hypothetical protein
MPLIRATDEQRPRQIVTDRPPAALPGRPAASRRNLEPPAGARGGGFPSRASGPIRQSPRDGKPLGRSTQEKISSPTGLESHGPRSLADHVGAYSRTQRVIHTSKSTTATAAIQALSCAFSSSSFARRRSVSSRPAGPMLRRLSAAPTVNSAIFCWVNHTSPSSWTSSERK